MLLLKKCSISSIKIRTAWGVSQYTVIQTTYGSTVINSGLDGQPSVRRRDVQGWGGVLSQGCSDGPDSPCGLACSGNKG